MAHQVQQMAYVGETPWHEADSEEMPKLSRSAKTNGYRDLTNRSYMGVDLGGRLHLEKVRWSVG